MCQRLEERKQKAQRKNEEASERAARHRSQEVIKTKIAFDEILSKDDLHKNKFVISFLIRRIKREIYSLIY